MENEEQEFEGWYNTFRVKDADKLNPKPHTFPVSMFDTIYNRLLMVCDELGTGPSDYIQKAVIAQLKKDKQWF